MNIGFDARYICDHFPGIGRYVANLVPALAALDHGYRLTLLYNPALPNTRHNLDALRRLPHVDLIATTARPFTLAEQIQIPRMAQALRIDLLHSPYYLKPYLGLPCPTVVTIHDLIGWQFPHTLTPHARRLFRIAMRLAVRTATRIITVSHNARDDIAYYYRIPHARIAVTPEAADERFRPQSAETIAALRHRYGLTAPYVLYVGANKPHKNLERLIHAWERVCATAATRPSPAPRLVIAGHYDPRYPSVQRIVTERGLTTSVTFLPNVPEADLPALYSGAELFVFPSYYEGFGLPPLEAMACGTPVVCAYTSSLPEVVGNAALTVDPFNFIELAEAIECLLHNPALRAYLHEQGLRQAQRFSWQQTARQTFDVYAAILSERSPASSRDSGEPFPGI